MKRAFRYIILGIAFIFVSIPLILNGCTPVRGEGFALYLTKEDVPPAQMQDANILDIAEQPIISMQDIITYNAQTHELKVMENAFDRVRNLKVPVRGTSFVICVDRKPIYWGAFWTPISSLSFQGVTIWQPYGTEKPEILTFELGYPSTSFYSGQDPRNSPEILKSLEQAGKLFDKLSISQVNQLPRSMKGYELYSWPEDGQWRFTLITGTNRNKTLDEIVTQEDFISETGWVKVTVTGVDAIETVLSKLPDNESVLWLADLRESAERPGIKIQLPPKQTSDAIDEFAHKRGLDFRIQGA